MTRPVRIAIDAMGGDHAPDIIVEGTAMASQNAPGTVFLLYGDEARIKNLLARFPELEKKSQIIHSDKVVAMDAKPSQALRTSRGTSMYAALESVKTGDAQAAVSAGNTGALMAISKIVLRTFAGVHRPAIAASWPSSHGVSVVLDVGANLQCDARQLVEFAIMGEAFARAVHHKPRPKVGLLNIGSEELKGHDEIREAAAMLRELDLELDFHGFVEGNDISHGTVDVVVTDGFTGNIALKTAEGTAKLVAGFVREALTSSPLARLGALLAMPALKGLRQRMDPRQANGGVFLGLNGVVVKSHGGTDALGFAIAVKVAIEMSQSDYAQEIAKNLSRLPNMTEPNHSQNADKAVVN